MRRQSPESIFVGNLDALRRLQRTPPAGQEEDTDPEEGRTEDIGANPTAVLEDLLIAQQFIHRMNQARLAHSGLDVETLRRLSAPARGTRALTRDERAGLRILLSRGNITGDTYTDMRAAYQEHSPDTTKDIPTHPQAERLLESVTGIHALRCDMCPNTCLAFTGPFATIEACPICKEPRYEPGDTARQPRTARRTFCTFPLGPQLQAMWASPENARLMRHRAMETKKIINARRRGARATHLEDVYNGTDYLARVEDGTISDNDSVLMFSIDGAQLYQSKQSDCWFYVWVLYDLPVSHRYKKRYVLPGGVIGGPRHPVNPESFLFPGLFHLAALMREGVQIWAGDTQDIFTDFPYCLFATADSPAMASMNGSVGHHGRQGCRMFCEQPGRHKPFRPTYYPALTRLIPDFPDDPPTIILDAKAEPDYTARARHYAENLKILESSQNATTYARNRLNTGIVKPTIFSGLPRFPGVPRGFPIDVMHLICLNLAQLTLDLLRGTMPCDGTDDRNTWDFAIFYNNPALWREHGTQVAAAARYLPGSFDRPPRNPAEKINSGFKAWEYNLYVYGLMPALLRPILPTQYYRHFCLLVFAARIVSQRKVSTSQLAEAHLAQHAYYTQFEQLYYQGRVDRLHFVRPSVHLFSHTARETERAGPHPCFSQWTIENYIGNITREIRQDVTPYANVSERALRRAQGSALQAMYPEFDTAPPPSRHSRPIPGHEDFILLHPVDKTSRYMTSSESNALLKHLRAAGSVHAEGWRPHVVRWGRLRLPNQQIARSAWREAYAEEQGKTPRRARMVKVRMNTLSRCIWLNILITAHGGSFRGGLVFLPAYPTP